MLKEENLMIPLNSDEEFFKSLYLTQPELHLDVPRTTMEIESLIPENARISESSDSNMKPEDFLPEKHFPYLMDIMIMRSSRYAPAFKHSHSFFEVACVLNGSCENHFASQTLYMEAGDICIISPQTVHAISAFSDNCILYNLMIRSATFEQTFLNSLPQQGILFNFFSHALYAPKSETYIYFKTGKDPLLFEILREIINEFNDEKSYYEVLLNSLLTNFFIKLLRRHEKNVLIPNPANHKDEENIIFILRYLTEHYNTITLKELAQFFNYSERQMARILKEYTGKSFTRLIQDIKLTKACDLLKNPELSIQDIVDMVGYCNANFFYRLFKAQYQITPAEYRRRLHTHENLILPG